MELAKEIREIREMLKIILQVLQGGQSPWFKTREAAQFLRCSESKVEQLTARGLLPYRRLDPTAPRSPRLYHVKDLTAYLIIGRNPQKSRLSPSEKRQMERLL